MSGGEILRHLLEEKQSYQVQPFTKHRVTGDTHMGSSRDSSPMVKQRGLQSRNLYPTPRRAMSDESPMTESHSWTAASKSNSIATESSFKGYQNFTDILPNTCTLDVLTIPRADETRTNEITDVYKCPTQPYTLSTPKLKSSMHPKSSSAGEDGYHSSRKTNKLSDGKLGKRRGKNASTIIRSRSLHSAEKSSSPALTKALEAVAKSGVGNRVNTEATSGNANPGSRIPEVASGPEGLFQVSVYENTSFANLSRCEDGRRSLKEFERQSHEKPRSSHMHNNMLVSSSGMGVTPQQSIQSTNHHGPYYATSPQNTIGHHQLPQKHPGTPSKQPSPGTPQSNSSIPRGPPPPYPQSSGAKDDNYPQRPNSLSLSGQISQKKLEYSGTQNTVAGLTSPALPTTTPHFNSFNYPLSAGTPPHESLFRSFPETTKHHDSNQESSETVNISHTLPLTDHIYTPNVFSMQAFGMVSPIRKTHYTRTAPGYQVSMSSQAPNTPSHADLNTSNTSNSAFSIKPLSRQDQPRSYNPNTSAHKPVTLPPPSYSFAEFQPNQPTAAIATPSNFSLGKSDSNASTSSGGSRIARRTKRNSKNYSNISGSSSSTGNSRPNSSADYLERIIGENEALKLQLVTSEAKVKKYQNVEKELSRVTEDYHNFRLSVTKSENMQSTLMSQLEMTTNRTKQENEILRERINTLTELVETLQSSGKEDSIPSADISAYKLKVQEMRNNERRMAEQYEEALEKISEQKEDIGLLSQSLERMQANVATLKEKLLQKQDLDRYAEKLSPFLESLAKIIQSREQAERELNDIAIVAQRQSTSSNDEGISEMDPSDFLSRAAQMQPISREQFARQHAQMLKLQHTYLQTAILRELSTFATAAMPSPLYSVLRKHRHAVSEPAGYIGNPFLNKSSPSKSERPCLYADNGKKTNCKKSSCEQVKDDGAQLHNSGRGRSSLRQRNAPNLESDRGLVDCSDTGLDHADDKVNSNTENSASNEVDSPSEGYHSQQSSGSPTPSSERSSLHFPEGENQISAALPSPQTTACPVNSPGKTILTKVVDV